MLQIPEDAVDEAMLALTRLGLGDAVDGVAMAAVHLISERHRVGEEAAGEQLAEQAVIEEVNDDDEDQACALVGLPQVGPRPLEGTPFPWVSLRGAYSPRWRAQGARGRLPNRVRRSARRSIMGGGRGSPVTGQGCRQLGN